MTIASIWDRIKVFFGGLSSFKKKSISIAIQVTEAIKNFDSAHAGLTDIITALIPGTVDDLIKDKIRQELPNIMVGLRLLESTNGLTDPNEIMLAANKFIATLDGEYKSAALHSIAVLVAQVAADGKLSWSDAVILVEAAVAASKK